MQHCRDFIKLDPLPVLLEILELPCMPMVVPSTAAFSSISSTFRIVSEVKPVETAKAILKQVAVHLENTKWFWETLGEESRLLDVVAPSESPSSAFPLHSMLRPLSIAKDNVNEQNARFSQVTVLLSHIALLSDIYSNLTYTHNKSTTAVLAVFASPSAAETLSQIGQLYRVASWESVLLKRLSPPATAAKPTPTPEAAATAPDVASTSAAAPVEGSSPPVAASAAVSPPTPNLKTVLEVVGQFPMNIMPILNGVCRGRAHA